MKNKYLLLLFVSVILSSAVEYRLTPTQNKKLRQAKSLYRNGLINEAKNIYSELLLNHNYLKEAYIPLKEILKKGEEWVELEKASNSYLNKTLYQESLIS